MPTCHLVSAVGLKDRELPNSFWSSAVKAASSTTCHSGPGPDLTPVSCSSLSPPPWTLQLHSQTISSCSSSNSLAALVGSLSHQSRLFLHPLLKSLKCHCSLLFKLYPFCNPYLIYTNMYIHPVLCGVWYELILVIKMELAVASARLPRQVDFKTHHCYRNGQYSWISC